MGLIGDLFPALDVPRKRDMDLEKMIRTTTTEMKLQPEEGFILKVVQLEELFAVRHSVFIIGNAGNLSIFCIIYVFFWLTWIAVYIEN